jgi:phosphatidylserine/phosphatidylglycerophosphate/cardiolipin synthase-like enzyme
MIKTVKTPLRKVFFELVSNSGNSIKISTPFIGEKPIESLYKNKNPKAELTFITKFTVNTFFKKSSDLDAIEKIIKNENLIKCMPNLHAKIYIFDDKFVLITSANLTNGGLRNNYEYGIVTDDKEVLKNVCSDFDEIFFSRDADKINENHIQSVRKIIANIPKEKKIKLPEVADIFGKKDEVYYGGIESVEKSLTGWKLEVFKRLNKIQSKTFSLNDIYKFKAELKSIYPDNTEIEAKIRQQLQFLRNLGLLEFFGKGDYKKLWVE